MASDQVAKCCEASSGRRILRPSSDEEGAKRIRLKICLSSCQSALAVPSPQESLASTREGSSSFTYPTLDSRNQQISLKKAEIHAISRFLRDNSMIRVAKLENRVHNSYFSPQILPRSHEIFRISLVGCLAPLLACPGFHPPKQ